MSHEGWIETINNNEGFLSSLNNDDNKKEFALKIIGRNLYSMEMGLGSENDDFARAFSQIHLKLEEICKKNVLKSSPNEHIAKSENNHAKASGLIFKTPFISNPKWISDYDLGEKLNINENEISEENSFEKKCLEKDIELVQSQVGNCDRKTAMDAIKKNNGDIVQAIIDLTK